MVEQEDSSALGLLVCHTMSDFLRFLSWHWFAAMRKSLQTMHCDL